MKLIELSHVIEDGMVTYKGLPAPHVCDWLSREDSRSAYESGTEFQIGQITLVGNTGTYLDAPFHRYAEGEDLADVGLERLVDLPGLVVRAPTDGAIGAEAFEGLDVAGKAVLVHTGWSRHWRTPAYYEGHPFLTEAAADRLAGGGAMLVGIDSHNIDDTRGRTRPVHSRLLGSGVLIVEHMCSLEALPEGPFRFHAAPPRIRAFGTFPVRAFAVVD